MTEYLDYLIQNPCLTLAAVFALTLLFIGQNSNEAFIPLALKRNFCCAACLGNGAIKFANIDGY